MAACNAEHLPLIKILLHAAKYSHTTVNGLLLGSVGSGGSAVKVTDVIPLFHNSVELAAPTEIALSQIEAYTEKAAGRPIVVGYYHSDARFQAADMDAISRRLADKLSEKYPQTVVVLLDNKKLASFLQQDGDAAGTSSSSHPFELFTHEGTRGWKREQQEQLVVSGGGSGLKELRESFFALFQQQAHRKLNDFDDHLDDPSKDYLNPELANMGKLQLPGQLR